MVFDFRYSLYPVCAFHCWSTRCMGCLRSQTTKPSYLKSYWYRYVYLYLAAVQHCDWWKRLQWTFYIGLVLIDVNELCEQQQQGKSLIFLPNSYRYTSSRFLFRLRGHLIVKSFNSRWDIHVIETELWHQLQKTSIFSVHNYRKRCKKIDLFQERVSK